MRKLRLLVVGVVLAFPIVTASPAQACTDQTDLNVCATMNYVCGKISGGGNCLG
jgi:hypothetical protein